MDDPFNSLETVKADGPGRVRKVMERGVKVEPMGPSKPPAAPPDAPVPPPAAGWDLSHDQLALDAGKAGLDEDGRYVPTWNRWLHWTGSHFAHDDRMLTYAVVRRFLRSVAQRIERWAEKEAANLDAKAAEKLRAWAKAECRTLRHKQTVAAVIDLARSNDAIAARPEDFDANPWLMATPGGTVDLQIGELREARRADLISKCCAVTPAPGRPGVWLKFLETTFDANPDVITFIHLALGYSLTGFTREHKLFFCFGSGANGKSTLLNLLAWLMNDYARRAPAETENPAVGIERLKVPKDRQRPHQPWPDAAVQRFRAEAGVAERLIFEIGVGSVQRPGDWLLFTWGDYDGDTLKLRQGKTGKALVLPCTAALKAALDAAKAALPYAPMPNLHIVTTRDGQRMTYRRMAEIMLAERQRLKLEAYDLHALRYRGVMELAWAGCDDDEIMSFSGHATKAMVVKYAGEARQIMRARQAREKRQ